MRRCSVLRFGGSKQLGVNPTYWWAVVRACHFSPGHHKVELYMDGALFATTEAHACEKSSVSREFVPCTSRFPTPNPHGCQLGKHP